MTFGDGQTVGQIMHHNAQGYEVTLSDASRDARSRFEKLLVDGRSGAMKLLETVNTRAIHDSLPSGADLAWDYDQAQLMMRVKQSAMEDASMRVHRHALGQLAARAGIPGAYLDALTTSENPALREQGAALLRTHYHSTDLATTPHLVRAVDGEARAVLSDRYKRLDSRPLLETFAEVCQQFGAVPVDATMSDVRMQLKAYLPTIFEPIPHEVMLVGLAWCNSDFGAGALGASLTVLRLQCTNKATGDTVLRQVHTGKRLDALGVRLSPETVRLETAMHASVLRDVARDALGPDRVNALMGQIRQAHEQKITWTQLRAKIANGTSKAECEQIRAAFEGADEQNLPAGQTAWRASNAVSWIAGQTTDADRRLDLERISGALMMGERAQQKAVDATA